MSTQKFMSGINLPYLVSQNPGLIKKLLRKKINEYSLGLTDDDG